MMPESLLKSCRARSGSFSLFLSILVLLFSWSTIELHASSSVSGDVRKARIMIVSSYHREYLWSQDTNEGVCAALLEFGYLDNREQAEVFTREDVVESAGAVIRKEWMDSKNKNTRKEIARALVRISRKIDEFKPDILLLGDDNAANYFGNHYLDSGMPMVFWGVNGLPLKYGIIDTLERPGHNITGIYQKGYHVESLVAFRKILPEIRRIGVLSDDSPTGRAHAKTLERSGAEGLLPVTIERIVITNSFEEWKGAALDLQSRVDGFYIASHSTLKDSQGRNVDCLEAAAWFFRNISKPSVALGRPAVMEGFLATVEDMAFEQGYQAMVVAYEILSKGVDPAEIPPRFTGQGPFIVNRKRAAMLGLDEKIKQSGLVVDEWIDTMLALEKHP